MNHPAMCNAACQDTMHRQKVTVIYVQKLSNADGFSSCICQTFILNANLCHCKTANLLGAHPICLSEYLIWTAPIFMQPDACAAQVLGLHCWPAEIFKSRRRQATPSNWCALIGVLPVEIFPDRVVCVGLASHTIVPFQASH